MKKLYAPWRSPYATGAEQKTKKTAGCAFCSVVTTPDNDEQNFILKRFDHTYVMLNLYPYNGGHLLVIPYAHTGTLNELEPQARAELIETTNTCVELLTKELKPDGFNIGINIGGKAAGGSMPEHLHVHILPRWLGDTSFLPTLADTKPLSQNLPLLYQQLKKALSQGAL